MSNQTEALPTDATNLPNEFLGTIDALKEQMDEVLQGGMSDPAMGVVDLPEDLTPAQAATARMKGIEQLARTLTRAITMMKAVDQDYVHKSVQRFQMSSALERLTAQETRARKLDHALEAALFDKNHAQMLVAHLKEKAALYNNRWYTFGSRTLGILLWVGVVMPLALCVVPFIALHSVLEVLERGVGDLREWLTNLFDPAFELLGGLVHPNRDNTEETEP